MRRWLCADQLGPHFLDGPRQPALLVESKGVFRRRRFHRQKAHLVLSALRHRAAELGDRAAFLRAETYGEALRELGEPVSVCHPTSRGARDLVRFMAHSMLSAPFNLGLLNPLEAVHAAEDAYRSGAAPLASVEGFVRQLIGWRDVVWHLYWYFESEYRGENRLGARSSLPEWFAELDAAHVDARCLADVLAGVRDRGWVHHIPRLMVLGNYACSGIGGRTSCPTGSTAASWTATSG